MKTGIITTILILFCCLVYGQNIGDGKINWNEDRKLELSDFKIRTNSKSIEPVLSQFILQTNSISNFEFFKRNFNNKVENIFLGNASWIDTTKIQQLDRQLEFQQIQFDICEIQARKMRKGMLLNKKKLRSKGNFMSQMMNDLMTEFSERRLELIEQTKNWTDQNKIDEWKRKIRFELDELSEFNYLNDKKIKKTSG